MNAPTRINPLFRIPDAEVTALVARVTALAERPERDSFEWRNLLVAMNAIAPSDELGALIDEVEDELGLNATECLACGRGGCGCDAWRDDYSLTYVERIAPNAVML